MWSLFTIRLASMLFHTTHLSAYLVLFYGLGGEAQAQFNLGTASSFSVIASSAITNIGSTIIDSQIGIFPNNANPVIGFPPGTVIASSDVSSRAKEDARAAYVAARSLYLTKDITGQDLGGQLLTPGTCSASSSSRSAQLLPPLHPRAWSSSTAHKPPM